MGCSSVSRTPSDNLGWVLCGTAMGRPQIKGHTTPVLEVFHFIQVLQSS